MNAVSYWIIIAIVWAVTVLCLQHFITSRLAQYLNARHPGPPTPCVICGQAITEFDSYGVGPLCHRFHWSCIRAEAATVSGVRNPDFLPVVEDPGFSMYDAPGAPKAFRRCVETLQYFVELTEAGKDDEGENQIIGYARLCMMVNSIAKQALDLQYPAPVVNLEAFQNEVSEWAAATFPGQTPGSKASHLHDEATELMDAPGDPEEQADIFILLLSLAHMHGYNLYEEAQKKMKINRARVWGKPDERGVVHHVEP